MIKYTTYWDGFIKHNYIIIDGKDVIISCVIEIDGIFNKLQSLYCQENYRNKGYATKLIKDLQIEYNELYLQVDNKNKLAKRLYKKLGFKFYEKIDNLIWMYWKYKDIK